MDKFLELKIYNGEGVDDALFPNSDNPIEIGAFRYDAKRMGGAPTITATVNYPECLDNEWTDNVYALFNGEKYFLKQTPTSSYDNTSTMYRHDIELVSERVILDDVYFFDAVVGTPQGDDKPVSNSTKVVFFGNVREFADRLNASLEYSGIGYRVEVDQEVGSEEKLMSFEDQFLSNVLQEIYNTYEVPYYFDGKTIRIGYSKAGVVAPEFSYGVDDALLSITKNNANYKIVNRATATGSSDNIPFYYPNNSPKGELAVGGSVAPLLKIVDGNAFANEVNIGDVVRYGSAKFSQVSLLISHDGNKYVTYNGEAIPVSIANMKPTNKWFAYTFNVSQRGRVYIGGKITVDANDDRPLTEFLSFAKVRNQSGDKTVSIKDGYIDCGQLSEGSWTLSLGFAFPYLGRTNYTVALSLGNESVDVWYNETQEKETSLKKMGLVLMSGGFSQGATITQELVKYVKTSQNLMPSVYRETDGDERFYNATNEIYPFKFADGYELKEGEYVGEDGMVHHPDYYEYSNPFVEGHPKEHIFSVEDIKPSIEGMEYNGQRIDMFEDIRFDEGDNDETYEDEDGNVYFKHPYFFAKLKPLGFNLFDHAIEQQPMVISFTKGDCGACNFEIAVDEDTQKNTVQVDASGNLVYVDGRVLCGAEGSGQGEVQPQPEQQDTTNRSVWIALRKEEDTYGILMPQYGKHEPSTEDTFVILGINLPYEYIEHAEKKLEAEIIKYLKENNDEKFTFSINFSRIYFEEEENKEVLKNLSENSKIAINYNGQRYELYVTSFSYTMSEGDALPEIRVELDDTLKVSQNALQNAISEVKSQLGKALGSIDVVGASTPYFIRKDADDEARGTINFKKGVKFGEGGKVEVMDNNSAKLTIEYLEVTKKASFTSLEIQEKTHVGGQMLVTPAAINCGEVEEFDGYYRCYFQTKGADGDEIYNQFAVGDQAICQTYNAWGSKYYWRLVTGIGEDYIDLSKTECDEDSDAPSAGDKIIQLGNQIDEARQNAIVVAAYGDGSPYIIQYKGIDNFEIPDDKIVTKLSSTENIFTGKVHMELGSDGFENLGGSLNIGNQNMLRNSGFTGDYLSEPLADNRVMDAADELFSAPFDHWTKGEHIERVELPDNAASGYGVQFPISTEEVVAEAETLSQELYYPVLKGEAYVLSFKAKGILLSEETNEETGEVVKTYNTISYTIGSGEAKEVALTDEWVRYAEKIVVEETTKEFSITASDVTLCEIQLERGTIATAWGNSPWDNSSDRTYVQSVAYLASALEVDAMTEGSTDVAGGLILTNHIKVGNYANHTMIEETAGMNGAQGLGKDTPAFWAGGDFDKAVTTAQKYKTDTETPEGEVPYVVTHGGKVVLNDAVVRGKVYAEEGVFSGFVKKTPTIINPSNYRDYLLADGDPMWFDLDLSKAGTFVVFEGEWADNPHFYMPQLNTTFVDRDSEGVPTSWKYYTLPRGYSIDEVFALVGQKVIIMNKANLNVQICTDSCYWIEPNNMGIYECEAKLYEDADFDGLKQWSVNWKKLIHEIPDFTTINPI